MTNENNFKKMTYVQRIRKRTGSIFSNKENTLRFLSMEYMGSAEFEFGAVGKSLHFLRSDVSTSFHTYDYKDRRFYVICNQKGFERFLKTIEGLIQYKYYTKEWTNIEKVLAGNSIETEAWLDVTGFVHYDEVNEEVYPIFFTLNQNLAIRTYLEFKREFKKVTEFNMFDNVYFYGSRHPAKIKGINEDDTYTLELKGGKTCKVHPLDIWSEEDYSVFNF